MELLHIKPATDQISRDVLTDADIAANGKAVVEGIHAADMERGVVATSATKIDVSNSTVELKLVTHHAAQ